MSAPCEIGRWGAFLAALVALGLGLAGADRLRQSRAARAQAVAMTGGDPDHGRALMVRHGCSTCHAARGAWPEGKGVGPPLDGLSRRVYLAGVLPNTPANLVAWIVDLRVIDPMTAMPRTGITEPEARDVAAFLYAMRQRGEMIPTGARRPLKDKHGLSYATLMNTFAMNNLGLLLHDAARLLRKRFEARSGDLGLPSAQWRLLVRLMREGKAPQIRLAELLEVEPISVSRLVDRMVEGGWVAREKDPTDRRVNLVVPTPKAIRAFADLRGMTEGVFEEALAGISPQDRKVLIAALATIVSNLSGPALSADCTPLACETAP